MRGQDKDSDSTTHILWDWISNKWMADGGSRVSRLEREVWISDRETRINEPCGNDVGNVSMKSCLVYIDTAR